MTETVSKVYVSGFEYFDIDSAKEPIHFGKIANIESKQPQKYASVKIEDSGIYL